MKRKFVTGAIVALTAMASVTVSANAQQSVHAQRQTVGGANQYTPNTPIEEASCQIYRTWMAESGLVFYCDGIAIVFDGGNLSGGISAAATMLLQYRSDESTVFVRYQMDPSNAACAEIRFTRYENLFEEGMCARAVSFGT